METGLTIKKDQLATAAQTQGMETLIKPLINEIHLFDSFVAGTSYLEDKSVLDEIKDGDELTLFREDNKFDDHAILIHTKDNRKLGYVPEADNVIFARLMDAGKKLIAKVNSIKHKGSFTQISISIYLVDF
jgi:hypothetical protein